MCMACANRTLRLFSSVVSVTWVTRTGLARAPRASSKYIGDMHTVGAFSAGFFRISDLPHREPQWNFMHPNGRRG